MNHSKHPMVGKSVLATFSKWLRFPDGKQYDCVYGVISEWGEVWVRIHDVHIKHQDIDGLVECDGGEFSYGIDRFATEDNNPIVFKKTLTRVAMAAVKKKGVNHE
jgi:hypothetical protein